jgi:hypothetical protein
MTIRLLTMLLFCGLAAFEDERLSGMEKIRHRRLQANRAYLHYTFPLLDTPIFRPKRHLPVIYRIIRILQINKRDRQLDLFVQNKARLTRPEPIVDRVQVP